MNIIFLRNKIFSFSAFTALLAVPLVSFAAQSNFFKCIIDRFIDKVAWPIFLGLVVIMFIYAGILFLTASGDPTKIGNARRAVIWAVVGVAVGFLAFSAVGLIRTIITPNQSATATTACP
ncbi:MAG: hypothetical protein Q7S10_01665 [bacterium]|nr:hypothetical protein [bacterium]